MRSRSFWRIVLTLKNVLASHAAHEFYVFLFFVLVSSCFWVIKTLQETYETEMAVPMELVDVPEGVVITRPLTDTLFVKVRDRGTTLFALYMRTVDNPMQVSYADFNTRQPIGTIVVPNIQKRLASYMPDGVAVVSVRPDTVAFAYNRGLCRKVPVRVCGGISTTPQYYIQKVRLSPDSVTVYAPQAVLDTMRAAYIDVYDCQDLQAGCHITAQLSDRPNTRFIPDTVGVTVSVDMFTEKTVTVPVTGVNFPAGRHLRTFPSTVGITFRVGTARYNNINAGDFVLAVPYEELVESRSARWHVRLRSLPDGASNPRFSPADVEYLIEQTAPNE